MNLWTLFPEQLIKIPGILKLPYVAIGLYAAVLLILFMKKDLHRGIAVFLGLSLIASTIMFYNLRPGFGTVLPPLALLLVMIYPLGMMLISIQKQQREPVKWWLFIGTAGVAHSLSWAVWLMALAGS